MKRNCTSICSFFFSSFVVQFSRYIRFASRFSLPFGKLVYYTTDFCVCQVLFESFFNFFKVFFSQPLLFVAVVFGDLCILSQTFSFVKGVSIFFRSFFQLLFLSTVFSNLRSLSATCVVYHFYPLLSTVFFNFFRVLCFEQKTDIESGCFMVYFHESENTSVFTYLRGRKKRLRGQEQLTE